MNDPRLTPFSGRVALGTLRGQVAAAAFTDGTLMRLKTPYTDLLRHPDGPRDRQVLRGAALLLIDTQDDMAYVQAQADGYCGWLPRAALQPDHPVTHRVQSRATHLYSAPDLKSTETATLSINAAVQITDQHGQFLRSACGGWLPAQHLRPVSAPEPDPVSVAERLLGTPYLWGGNTSAGLDCSALVQLALQACARPCPGDSDLQEAALGRALPTGTAPKRGDLLFWRGHVAWVSAPDMILHANAHTMSVAYEPLPQAIARIAPESPVTSHRRL